MKIYAAVFALAVFQPSTCLQVPHAFTAKSEKSKLSVASNYLSTLGHAPSDVSKRDVAKYGLPVEHVNGGFAPPPPRDAIEDEMRANILESELRTQKAELRVRELEEQIRKQRAVEEALEHRALEEQLMRENSLLDQMEMARQTSREFTSMDHPSMERQRDTARQPTILDSPGKTVSRIWESTDPVKVQGGALQTWSFDPSHVERVLVSLKTNGRPLDADVELWQGPDNTPQRMKVYVEDGGERAFNAVVETPRAASTVAVRNTGFLEFPLSAAVAQVGEDHSARRLMELRDSTTIQGGALRTYPFPPEVESVQCLLRTDGRPLSARIELMQGPNNNKQVIELYTEDGLERPFFVVFETPGSGNTVRVVNTGSLEFPMTACIEAYSVGDRRRGPKEPTMLSEKFGQKYFD